MAEFLFHEIYRTCTAAHDGAFIPRMAAQLMADRTGLDVATIHAELTRPVIFFYEDVLPTLDRILDRAEITPIIWTEGELSDADGSPGYQALKVRAARLFQRYPQWIERAARLDLPPIIGGFTKSQALASMRPLLDRHPVDGVTVVDDKAEQLTTAHSILSAFVPSLQLLQIHRSAATTVDHPFIHPIPRLSDLLPLIPAGRQLILFDLDYTLIDHARTRQEMAERMERIVHNAK